MHTTQVTSRYGQYQVGIRRELNPREETVYQSLENTVLIISNTLKKPTVATTTMSGQGITRGPLDKTT